MSVVTSHTLEVDGHSLEVSSLEKIFYPATGFTKGGVIDYYIRVAPFMLPYLKNRALTLKRYPDGVEGFFFYEKQCPSHRPDWVKTSEVPKDDGSDIDYCTVRDLRSLVWAANLANLEFHTFLHRVGSPRTPNFMVFDLDPGAPADIIACCRVALTLRELLDDLGLRCFPKTSGSKGLQIYIPLNRRATYETTKPFARAVAEQMEERHGELVVSKMQKSLRKGKVLIDWSQNDDHKTTVCVYSLRAKTKPSVSMPVTWDEVEKAVKTKKSAPLFYSPGEALRCLEKRGDLFEPVLTLKQSLPS